MPDRPEAIAIVGMAGRFPGADDVAALWARLCAGEECLTRFTPAELNAAGVPEAQWRDAAYVPVNGRLAGIDRFDADFFGFSARDAAIADPQQRLLLEIAWHALEDAGLDPAAGSGAVGVFAGCGMSGYLLHCLLPRYGELADVGDLRVKMGNGQEYLASRLAWKLNLTGPCLSVNSACSTSLIAVHVACDSLLSQQCDAALAGGISLQLPQDAGYLHREGGILSRDGHCRAFDARATGTVNGNGGALVVLKRLADAAAAGDRVYAVIRGSAVNNDGGDKPGFTAPSLNGQRRVIEEALEISGIEADAVGYIEAHGTGTPLGDPIEFAALNAVYRPRTTRRRFCALGSVKTNVGHLDEAAGVTGLIKAALCLHRRRIPPSLHFTAPNPELDYADSPFFVNAALRAWEAPAAGPRAAGVSSFGIGGSNAHVVLEEPPPPPPSARGEAPAQILPYSARTPRARERARENLAACLEREPDLELAAAAWTAQTGRRAFACRGFAVAADRASAAAALRAPAAAAPPAPDRAPPVVFLFSGQGSQHAGMTRRLWRHEPTFRHWIETCAGLLREAGFAPDLRALLDPAAGEAAAAAAALARTENAQPALFAVEYALAKLWERRGVRPAVMLGHSLGELVAACLGGALDLPSALAAVVARGALMQAAPPGAMLAVSLPAGELAEMLPPGVALAADNAPDRCVASGEGAAVAALSARLAARGIAHRRLAVAQAFHGAAMDRAAEEFRARTAGVAWRVPAARWISNLDGDWVDAAAAAGPDYYARLMRAPVQFRNGLLRAAELFPGAVFLEIGPGDALTQLARRTARGAGCVAGCAAAPEGDDYRAALQAAGELWTLGVPIDWSALGAAGSRRVSLPGYPFEPTRFWIDAAASETRKEPDPARWWYAPTWKRRERDASPPIRVDRWLMLDDASDEAAALAAALRRSAPLTTVRPGDAYRRESAGAYVVRVGHGDDFERLADDLAAAGELPGEVVHFWCRRPARDLDAALAAGFFSLAFLARALARRRPAGFGMSVVTANLHDVTGEEALDPAQATLLGAVRTIPQELTGVTVRNLDLPATLDRAAIGQLAADLTRGDRAAILCTRGAYRWEPVYEPVTLAPAASWLRPRGVYLITGGLGRIGRVLAAYLAETAQARLVLTGRTAAADDPFPRELEALGGLVQAERADVGDAAAMEDVVARAEARFGAVDGIFHAAGAPLARTLLPVADIEAGACREHFAVKAGGAEALARVFQRRSPAFLVLFSSLSTVLGGLGYAPYAAANHYLDALARRGNRASRCRHLSLALDGWGEGNFIGDAEGRRLFALLLHGPRQFSQLAVSTTNLPARIRRWVERPAMPPPAAATVGADGDPLAALWREALGVAEIGPDDNFFRLHGDSLQATQLVARINQALGARLALRDFFEAPTLRGLRTRLEARRGTEAAIPPAPAAADYALTPNQRRLWTLCQDETASLAYNMTYGLHLRGPVRADTLRAAFECLLARHESLRTGFVAASNSEPRQRIAAPMPFELPIEDLGAAADPPAAVAAALRAEAMRPFALARPPLLRARLLRLGAEEAVLLFSLHHLVCDGLSLEVLLRELACACAALEAGGAPQLPPLGLQYKDFAEWQRRRLEGPRREELRRYWGEKLEAMPTLELPPAGAGASAGAEFAGRAHAGLDAARLAQLHELAARGGATLFSLLTAATKVLLHAWTGQADIVLATPMAGRERPELAPQVGYYLNTVLLRDTIRRGEPFTALLARVHRTVTEALTHQEYPLDLLAAELDAPVQGGHLQLANVQINLMPALPANLRLGRFRAAPLPGPESPPLFDLNFMFHEGADGLRLELAYDAARLGRQAAERLAPRLMEMLALVARDGHAAVRALCGPVAAAATEMA